MSKLKYLARGPQSVVVAAAAALALVGTVLLVRADDKKAAPAAAPRPALSVTVTQAQSASLPLKIAANGNIAAWQEASIGTEANGLRLAEVRVNVGDVVKRGQVLATFAPDMMQADVAQIRAMVAEAEAALAEATVNAKRARELQTSGALSDQQINQYMTAERTAQARLDAQRAQANVQALRLRQTQVLAPDDGVISARSATVGAVLPAGTELFRMIRQGRLEWRAEVAAGDLARVKPGMGATVTPSGGAPIAGKVRMVAPTVDRADTQRHRLRRPGAFRRCARRHVRAWRVRDRPGPGPDAAAKCGAAARWLCYVLRIGADFKVSETKVTVGRRVGERIEITGGLDANARVVASGGGFLSDGDTVRVVDGPAPAAQAAAKPAAAVTK